MPPKTSDIPTTGMKRSRSHLLDEGASDENRAPTSTTPPGGMASAISKSKRQRLSNVFDQQTFSSPTGPALDPFAASSPVTLGFLTTPPVATATPAAGVRASARRTAAKKQAQTPAANTPKKKFVVERPPAKKLVFEETWKELGPTGEKGGKKGDKGLRNPSPPPAKVLNGDGEEVAEGEESKQAKQRRGGTSKKSRSDDIYEVPDDSEDELKLNGTADRQPTKEQQQPEKKKGGRQRKQKETTATDDAKDPPPPKKRGRPRKADRIAAAEKDTDSATPTKVSRRQPRITKKKSADSVEEIGDSEEEADDAIDDQLLADLDYEDGKKSHQPELKGVLSPRKKKLGEDGDRRRKSVAFSRSEEAEGEDEEKEETEIAFEDLPTKEKERFLRQYEKDIDPGTPVVGDEDDDEDAAVEGEEEVDTATEGSGDDEVCVICSKPDTKRGNQIVFCDGCDKAVHQKCYGIPRLPKGDWYCRECVEQGKDKELKEIVTSSATTRKEEQTMATIGAVPDEKVPDIPNFEQHLRSLQRVLVERCTGRRRIKLRGQEEAYAKTCQLVEQTIVAGEGNSMMVIGARGSGKTTLVESIISDMSAQYKDEFHVVRLNGFIHTDDKLALREIWRQLGKEMAVEDELISKTTNNHADTMASLLALLSHPAEIGMAPPQDGVTSRSIIFLIDEFDLFATHARQTLLYNLFDIAQARKAPIAVLGLTTRIDVVESLEKRVKSRFSHRYVYLSLTKSLPAYWEICKQGLVVDDEDVEAEGIDQAVEGHTAFTEWWNGKVVALHKTLSFQHHLESHFYSTKSVPAFLTSCILPLSTLSPSSPTLRIPPTRTPSSHTTTLTTEPPDSKLHLLASLSDLDLSMLIAAARLDIVAHTDTVNFAMAYDEYTSLMSRMRVQSASAGLLALGGGSRVWGRGIAGIAWERLVTLGLLVPAAGSLGDGGANARGAGATLGQSGGGLEGKMWRVDVALEEIPAAVKLNQVLARWCKEI